MTIKKLFKSGMFTLAVLVLFVALLPFAIEQFGDAFDLFSFPATKWVKELFTSESVENKTSPNQNTNWKKQEDDLKAFCDWADGLAGVEISIIRPEVFQIVRADPDPAKETHFSWKLILLSDTLTVDEAQVRSRLKLICDPQDKVSGQITSVKRLSGSEEKGFLVTVDHVRGGGKVGLSYNELLPVFYSVELRSLWLVPIASCRSAVKGKYDSEVFFPGMRKGLSEGEIISPGRDKCGYRILSISDHCVWFEAFYDSEPQKDELVHSVWPDFSRVDTRHPTPPPGRLIFGKNRCFWPGEAIRLPSGNILQLDNLIAGKAAVFRQLGPDMLPKYDLLCVIVREK